MKKAVTAGELFQTVCEIIKGKGKMPDILDYAQPAQTNEPITNYEFDISNSLAYGSCEGIYLPIGLQFSNGKKMHIGTFKTLEETEEAMKIMATLLAEFLIEGQKYVNSHLDDFDLEGFRVRMEDAGGKSPGFNYRMEERVSAEEKKDELLSKYPVVHIEDMATGKITTYKRGEA